MRLFLCHSSVDKTAVRALHARLRAGGFEPWLDAVDLLPGQDWHYEIRNAIRRSDAVIVCLSRESVGRRGYVNREIKFALDVAEEFPEGEIFVVPVRLEECEIPQRLQHLHTIDLFEEGGYELLTRVEARCAAGG